MDYFSDKFYDIFNVFYNIIFYNRYTKVEFLDKREGE